MTASEFRALGHMHRLMKRNICQSDVYLSMKKSDERKKRLEAAVRFHGHLCLGQVLGVLLAEKGLGLVRTDDTRKLIVISENDRCIADALQIVTGTRLGRRSFKLNDLGKMAATFCNLETGKAYRVFVKGRKLESRDYHAMSSAAQKRFIDEMLCAKLDDVIGYEKVIVEFRPEELPGKPQIRVACDACGEKVMDGKHVEVSGRNLCRTCAQGSYYRKVTG